eukprot:Phypoly_transcript_06176.p1 GENE.Phypoly_transcript_06176~~Phypoly_transcript_06176.p1  ORF type:complete len:534 (+),score=38.24 Phypoly_transcript_06176:118-1719(+)
MPCFPSPIPTYPLTPEVKFHCSQAGPSFHELWVTVNGLERLWGLADIMHAHHVEVDPSDTRYKPKLSPFKFFCLSLAFLGVQFGWALQIAFTSPIFLTLGVKKTEISLIWLAGPISGFIVQPVVGAISDSWYTRFGRRAPFIFAGGLCIILGLGLVSNAPVLGKLITGGATQSRLSIFIAIVGFWILDLSNNTVQGPCRALLVDVAPQEQQGLGSAWFSFMLGTGNLLGYFIGSLNLLKVVPFMGTQYQALFTTSMIVLAVCVAVTLISTRERCEPPTTKRKIENPFKTIFKGITHMPPAVSRVCAVQFFSWISWFTFILFITTWVGEDVFGGDPNAPEGTPTRTKFDDGVQHGARALSYQSAVTMVMSVVLPKIVQWTGYRTVYFTSQIILAAALISTYWIKTTIGAMSIIVVCGIPWTVTMVLPFAIVGQGVAPHESGLYMGVLNIFVVIPQILVSLLIPIVITLFHHKTVSALITGGIASVIAAVVALRLVTPKIQVIEVDPALALKTEHQPLLHDEAQIGYSTNAEYVQ